ncbi:MAG: T9SS type A sorting domain-containing protein [Flavobacteriales bacterium]
MKRNLLLSSFLLSTAVFAQLAPNAHAPLMDHLREVNAEWRSFKGTLDATPVAFNSDTDRIAKHLHLVREHLATHGPEGLSAAQAHERSQLLEALEAYADRGIFPKNHVLPYRNPVFIDPHGTACAVGQLMIESGSADLAMRIDAEMELAYIHEIDMPEVGEWAKAHGFTADELAWIQPGYAPAVPWFVLGEGTNGTVDEVLTLANGDLLVVGQFTDAGGTAGNGAAIWNGSSYTPLGSLPEGVVNCAIEHDGELFIGGSFNGGQIDLLRWSGSGWTGEFVFASKAGEVTALLSHDGMLYAAGGASGFAGVDFSMKVLQAGEWLQTPGWLNGPIHALEFHEGYIVAGGTFTGAFASQNDDIQHVARYADSGWLQVADGLDGGVYDLLVHDGTLYATGMMMSMIGPYFGLASIAGEATSWTQLMPNIEDYITVAPTDGPSVAKSMVMKDDRIFIAGDIYSYSGLTFGRGLVVYNGAPDAVEPYCDFLGAANSIALLPNDQLVLAGASEAFSNIVVTDLTSGLAENEDALSLTFAPNPAKEVLNIGLPSGMNATTIRLTDAAGRIVNTEAASTGTVRAIDIRALANGFYHVEVNDGIRTATGRFVKE